MKVGLKKYLMTSANFFRFVGPGSPIFFVLWGPDRHFFAFYGARIANCFRFVGPGSPTFFRFVGPGSPFFCVLWGHIANVFRFQGSGSPIETKTEKLKSTRKRKRYEIYLL